MCRNSRIRLEFSKKSEYDPKMNKMDNKISIIIPAYNIESYIESTLDNYLNTIGTIVTNHSNKLSDIYQTYTSLKRKKAMLPNAAKKKNSKRKKENFIPVIRTAMGITADRT